MFVVKEKNILLKPSPNVNVSSTEWAKGVLKSFFISFFFFNLHVVKD